MSNYEQIYQEAYQLWQSGYKAEALDKILPLTEQTNQDAIFNLAAVLLCENNRIDEGITMWQRLPNWEQSTTMLSNMGSAYHRMNRHKEAYDFFQRALQVDEKNVDAWFNSSVVLRKLKKHDEATQCLERILEIAPDYVDAKFNLAHEYRNHFKLPQAIQLYREILNTQPENDEAKFGLAVCLQGNHEGESALPFYQDLLENHTGYAKAFPNMMFSLHYMTHMQPENLFAEAKHHGDRIVRTLCKKTAPKPTLEQKNKRLHIGILSADLCLHPVGYFVSSLLKSQATEQFDWSAYANNEPDHFDTLSDYIKPRFKNWHAIHDLTDEQVIKKIQADKIDILLDLSGLTKGHRIGVIAAQAAPVQINWLGYFATTGLSTEQAVIADPYCVPEGEEKWFVEKVWRMPHTRLCMHEPPEAGEINPLPALKNSYITFGCFQNIQKINLSVLSTWAEIARTLPNARWRIQADKLKPNSLHMQKFKETLRQSGLDESRVDIHEATDLIDYFKAYNEIDIILDTFPYPGGTTTCQALWMGVPTLTLTQPGMLARQGEQLMSAAQLPDWICHNEAEYLGKAIYWANPARWGMLNAMRLGMREHVRKTPLFDYQQFGSDWADLVKQIWQDACQSSNE
ncbi:tetratricopeptide repeat protein [Kingella negevensis]|uniref:O-linked N-acetylglucosamine transferase, SPINDLY family protein n=1 Tax=Kingella negevensis TaxID=1522312 RepID=UPI00254F637E|nr:tetratricopeptide repeat protein [Kingella negevensis]MDK4684551.1 tetratricopeptide repeat protein [Kingella negevensis]MDK4707678.1 tetratricopeptide repeat protein [Kingella negevensis]MDK4709886.1 tetratricopeptide repeat protein [Kingella negevensis]